MTTPDATPTPQNYEPQRRLSPWRVMLGLVVFALFTASGIIGTQRWLAAQFSTTSTPWFAAYVDVTATPAYAFEQAETAPQREIVLSFIVSSPNDVCTPTWGGAYTMDKASESLDLDRRIARFRQKKGNIVVSFGGLKNDELAVNCTDPAALKAAYKSVIDRYDIDTIDLDLEQSGLTNTEAGVRRAQAIAQLQTERRADGKKLAVWVTLPVAPQGLTEDGTNAVALLLDNGVDLTGVNLMTMDFGGSLENGQSMLEGSRNALTSTHRQLGILYQQVGLPQNDAAIWSKIGATPMIGQNDVRDEVFGLDDAKGLSEFALSKGIGRMSMWSANRDIACGENYADIKVVSDSCSGIDQEKGAFSALLSKGFKGTISSSAGTVTVADASDNTEPKKDDPATSPYQIWSESGAYLQGTKVVWYQNVYEAKWWTQGDLPDNPVLQSWQTPWKLIGPVLPNEKPVEQTKLPAGFYPEWSGTTAYDTDQRVLFNGTPYQAKWWTQGDSPAAAVSNANASPWVPLTQAQINAVLAEKNAAQPSN